MKITTLDGISYNLDMLNAANLCKAQNEEIDDATVQTLLDLVHASGYHEICVRTCWYLMDAHVFMLLPLIRFQDALGGKYGLHGDGSYLKAQHLRDKANVERQFQELKELMDLHLPKNPKTMKSLNAIEALIEEL